jgi:hypothetical protein
MTIKAIVRADHPVYPNRVGNLISDSDESKSVLLVSTVEGRKSYFVVAPTDIQRISSDLPDDYI